jgi:hypothetical protein
VGKKVKQIFEYREEQLKKIFAWVKRNTE